MSKIKIEKSLQEVSIVFRWLKPQHFFMLFFFIAWDAFLIFWYSMSLGSGDLIASVFPIAHVAVGIAGSYYVITGLINRTRIKLNKKELTVRHYPLPWIGNKTINSREITQFYLKEKLRQGKNGTIRTYQLRYLDRKQNDKNLLPFGVTVDIADVQKMERIFEEYLGIKDFLVHGEYGNKAFQSKTSREEFKIPISHPVSEDPMNRTLFDIQLDGFVDFELDSYQIKDILQYDVDATKTFKMLITDGPTDDLIFFFQTDGPKTIMVEKEVPVFTIETEKPLENKPLKIKLKGENFRYSNKVSAEKFDLRSNSPLGETIIMFYSSEDYDQILRIELSKGEVRSAFLGELKQESSFSNVLPPPN